MGDKLSWKRKLAALAVLTGSVTGIMHTVNKLVYYISTVDNLLDYNKYNYYEWRFEMCIRDSCNYYRTSIDCLLIFSNTRRFRQTGTKHFSNKQPAYGRNFD